jgi:hypothetical protein
MCSETTFELSHRANPINNKYTFIILLIAKYVLLLKKFRDMHFTHAICACNPKPSDKS